MKGYHIKDWPASKLGETRRIQSVLRLLGNLGLIILSSLYFGLAGSIIAYSGIHSPSTQQTLFEIEHYVSEQPVYDRHHIF